MLETEYDRPVSYGILRCEFDAYLLHRSGADVRAGTRVETIERDGRDWIVDGDLRAPLLAGAGGHFCPVARHLGARRERDPVVVAQEIEWPLRPDQERETAVRGDTPELYFCADLKGYGWAFRKGDRLNVGLGRLDRQGLAAHVAAFHEFLVSARRVPSDLPRRWHGHAYLLYEAQRPRIVDDGALLVGDAAGLAYAASGEGIRPAVESALLAAQVVVAARGRYGQADLEPYRRALEARFGTGRAALRLPIPAGLAGRGRTAPLQRPLVREAGGPRPVVPARRPARAGERPLGLAVPDPGRASPPRSRARTCPARAGRREGAPAPGSPCSNRRPRPRARAGGKP